MNRFVNTLYGIHLAMQPLHFQTILQAVCQIFHSAEIGTVDYWNRKQACYQLSHTPA
jgi:hypothetical protein